MGLQNFEFRSFSLGVGFELAKLGFFRRIADDFGFQLVEAFLDRLFAAKRDFGFLVQAIDEFCNFTRQLTFQSGKIALQLAHAGMARQQARG